MFTVDFSSPALRPSTWRLGFRSLCLVALSIAFLPPAAFAQAKPPAAQNRPARGGKVFILTNSSRDLNEFRAFAKVASRLKRHGRVQIDIGVLADRAHHEIPDVRSPWHEYAFWNANISKFYPHPKIAPFLPADWVAKNRALLLAKAAILREFGLEAALSSNDTHYLPEAFFEKYPHLRGPRVDHPRRSAKEEFTFCLDLPETREMVEWMTAEIKRNVPELKTILVHVNDSGTGLCWADWQYSGSNGPRHCRNRNVGERVRDFFEAIHRGAQKGGGDVAIRLGGMLSQREQEQIVRALPPNSFLSGRDPLNIDGANTRDASVLGLTTLINDAYPILGLINPLSVFATMHRADDPAVRTIIINSSISWYYRANEPLHVVERMIDVVESGLEAPPHDADARQSKLRALAQQWGGEKNAAFVYDAFMKLDEAMRLKAEAAPQYSNLYVGVSMRHITRPLLIKPELLTAAEEAYFLPHVFNVYESGARNDYRDLHGGRFRGPEDWEDPKLKTAFAKALESADLFEKVKDAPQERWLRQLALALRMWTSEVRSINNFYFAQKIRNAHATELAGKPIRPSMEPTMTGDPDYLKWNMIQRDEFENAHELVELLKNGGLEVFAHAKRPELEDTFLFGPDVIGALQQKVRLMRKHWLTVQKYLTSPFI